MASRQQQQQPAVRGPVNIVFPRLKRRKNYSTGGEAVRVQPAQEETTAYNSSRVDKTWAV